MRSNCIFRVVTPLVYIIICLLNTQHLAAKGRSSSEDTIRPNILMITSEDNSPFLGCYGDAFATTPNLDRLATEGVLFANAFSNTAVCAPVRSTLITGMYALSLGTQGMRSTYPIPESIEFYPALLREQGYYCTNNAKKDYNTTDRPEVWDESGAEAHYSNRAEGQPFFHIRNLGVSHESAVHRFTPNSDLKHSPNEVPLPPYHPNTEEMRHDWAQYYDVMTELDSQVGAILKQLEEEGLSENTIVIYFSDHGGVLGRSKRYIYDTGTKVPLIIRVPESLKHLSPWSAGEITERMVGFIDVTPTLLSIAGVDIPKYMQGSPFMGQKISKAKECVHLFRNRMDERFDMMRGVRDSQFKYIKNYTPYRIYGQHINYLWRAPSMQSWEREHLAGNLNETQSRFWNKKQVEELYDIDSDPWEVNNLANNPKYREVLERMRKENSKWVAKVSDTGFIPEGERIEISKRSNRPIYEAIKDLDLKAIIEAADLALSKQVTADELKAMLDNNSASIRYWGAVGILTQLECYKTTFSIEESSQLQEKLLSGLNDNSFSYRVAAAETLHALGREREATEALLEIITLDSNMMERCYAINALEYRGEGQNSTVLSKLKEFLKLEESKSSYSSKNYDVRVASWLTSPKQ